MITINIDVTNGLCNGACGTVKSLTFKDASNRDGHSNEESDNVEIIWIDFNNEKIGQKAKMAVKSDAHKNESWVPIVRDTKTFSPSKAKADFNVVKQFPLRPAEVITIHKSQGQTYESICLDLRDSKNKKKSVTLRTQLQYVALSRGTKLSGIYILGNFTVKSIPEEAARLALSEIKRLKEDLKKELTKLQLSFETFENKKGDLER